MWRTFPHCTNSIHLSDKPTIRQRGLLSFVNEYLGDLPFFEENRHCEDWTLSAARPVARAMKRFKNGAEDGIAARHERKHQRATETILP